MTADLAGQATYAGGMTGLAIDIEGGTTVHDVLLFSGDAGAASEQLFACFFDNYDNMYDHSKEANSS